MNRRNWGIGNWGLGGWMDGENGMERTTNCSESVGFFRYKSNAKTNGKEGIVSGISSPLIFLVIFFFTEILSSK